MDQIVGVDELKIALWGLEVRVRTENGKDKLTILGGDVLSPEIKAAIKAHRDDLIEYYGRPEFFQDELDDLKGRLEEVGENSPQSGPLWISYYQTLENRARAMEHPWARIPEDHRRCPGCPNLGQPADAEGILCACRCAR